MPVLTVNVSDELFEQLQKLAIDMESTVEECQVWALEDFVAEERASMDGILEGIRDIEEGRFVTQEQMEAWHQSLSTANPLPRPTPENTALQRAS